MTNQKLQEEETTQSIGKSLRLFRIRYRLENKMPEAMPLTLTRDLVTPLVDALAREDLKTSEVQILISNLSTKTNQEYWNYLCDSEWIKRSWNRPEQLLISLFTRFTNWPGDPYAMAQRQKTVV